MEIEPSAEEQLYELKADIVTKLEMYFVNLIKEK